jgi:protein involved in polysaccharide export with SLBB domain
VLASLLLLAPLHQAVAQTGPLGRGTMTGTQDDDEDEGDTARTAADEEGLEEELEQPELTPEELERLRELLETEEERKEEAEKAEKEAPPTAAERFSELERFGMRVFGYIPPEPKDEEKEEEADDTEKREKAEQEGTTEERSDRREEQQRRTDDEDEEEATSDREEREAESDQQLASVRTRMSTRPRRPRPIRETRVSGVVASEAVPPTYVLGPGDQLAVRVWTDAIEHVEAQPTVDAEGNVYLELLGEITVAGERLSRVREIVHQRYRTFFDRAEVSVGLSRTRVIEVRVTGAVQWPGTHVLSGAATLFSALHAAGGPNEAGSFRAIKLIRRGEEPVVVDLYDYLLNGNIDADVPLEPNDTIFVPPLGAEFGVAGEVRRPARYEMKEDVTVSEALQMAAGVSATGYAKNAEIWRVGESGIRELINVDARTEGAQVCMQSGDLLVIPPVLEDPENVVELKGAVRRAGRYQVRDGMTVGDLLRLAHGPSTEAHAEEAVVWRMDDDLDYDLIHFDLSAALAGDPTHDISLMPRDRVIVFSEKEVEAPMEVTAEGAVREPDTFDWTRGMRVSDLVKQAGGLFEGAYTPQANLLRLGEDQRREIIGVNLELALAGDEKENLELQRGDILNVLSREEATEASQVRVTGLVQEQGWYDRLQGMRVSDAILAAGGPDAEAGNEVEYTPGGAVGQVEPIYLSLRREADGFEVEPDPVLQDNDVVAVLGTGELIPSAPIATIRGRVATPGVYAVQSTQNDPDTVYDLIERAGGLLPNANPNGIVLYRLREEIIAHEQEGDLEQVIAHFNRELAAATVEGEEQRAAGTSAQVSQGLQAALSEGTATVVIPPRRLSKRQWARAVPINGERLIATEGEEGDFPLTEGDVVVVPETPTTVTVMGAVVRPGAVPYEEDLRPLDYIAQAGDLTPDARKSRTVVIRANGEVSPKALHTTIRPGDIILVPSDYIFRDVNAPGTFERVLNAVTAVIGGYLLFN